MPTRPKTFGSAQRADTRKQYEQLRGSASARGYDYQWQKYRESYLRAHPLCQDCLDQNRTAAATDVHHMAKASENPELFYEPTNHRALCKACHSKRTKRGE